MEKTKGFTDAEAEAFTRYLTQTNEKKKSKTEEQIQKIINLKYGIMISNEKIKCKVIGNEI